jgi:hypothetical protein
MAGQNVEGEIVVRTKRQASGLLWGIAVAAGITFLPSRPAYAYLDPGTGSFLLQILLAGFLGLVLTLRLFRDKIAAVFRRLLGRQPEAASSPSPDKPNTEA